MKTEAKGVLTIDSSLNMDIKRIKNTKEMWEMPKIFFDFASFTTHKLSGTRPYKCLKE